jgi:hypothetical protein
MQPFLNPITLIFVEEWNTDVVLDTIETLVHSLMIRSLKQVNARPISSSHRVQYLVLVPSLISPLVERQKTRRADLSSIIWMDSTAAHTPVELQNQLKESLPGAAMSMG